MPGGCALVTWNARITCGASSVCSGVSPSAMHTMPRQHSSRRRSNQAFSPGFNSGHTLLVRLRGLYLSITQPRSTGSPEMLGVSTWFRLGRREWCSVFRVFTTSTFGSGVSAADSVHPHKLVLPAPTSNTCVGVCVSGIRG